MMRARVLDVTFPNERAAMMIGPSNPTYWPCPVIAAKTRWEILRPRASWCTGGVAKWRCPLRSPAACSHRVRSAL